VTNQLDHEKAAIEQAPHDEDYVRLLQGAEEIAAINDDLRAELRGIHATLQYVQAELDQQTAYSAKLRELMDLRAQLDSAQLGTAPAQAAVTEEHDEVRFAGHDGRECGEHRTAGGRAWCFDCSEWCSLDVPCKGCELPSLHDELERAQRELTVWQTTFGESALREHIATTEQDVSAFEASQELLRSAADTIADLRARLAVLPEWRCPRCGATTRARMADAREESDAQ
jgi:hypothetical protein